MARHPDSRSTDAAGTCVIYTRVSQDRYKTEDAVERQEKDCRKKAKELGLKVVRSTPTTTARQRTAASATTSRPCWPPGPRRSSPGTRTGCCA